jgi:hypothetical protein
MSSALFLDNFGQQFSMYSGILILVLGVIGGITNILVFVSLKTFRENSCAFYLTAMSFLNIGQLLTSLLPRVMNLWFSIDWAVASLIYCKIRVYCFQTSALTSLTCMCLTTIDQFMATCSVARWQQYSSIKFAHRFFIISVFVWLLHGIPNLILYNHIISPMTGNYACAISSKKYQDYTTYGFNIVLVSSLPVLVTVLFGSLAYRNVTQLAYRAVPLVRRELDKQLTVMVLVQVVYNFCFIVPYVIVNIVNLSVNANQDSYSYAQIQLARSITVSLFYLYYAVSVELAVNILM